MQVFDPDSKGMILLSNVIDYVKLGLMVILFSIPVVTLGTSIAAGMTLAMKMERGEAPAVVKPFKKAFRENFRQGLPLTIVFELLFALLALDWYQVMKMERTLIVHHYFIFINIHMHIWLYIIYIMRRNRILVK